MSIFVGNLPFRAEREDVLELFTPFGEVVNCSLPLERDTGRKRGFAFVEMSDEAIESAMLHDMLFKVEKKAIAANMATQDQVDKTQHYADMIMELAEEMNLVDEHDYVEDVHKAKIKELAGMEKEEEDEKDDDMTPPSVRMMNAS